MAGCIALCTPMAIALICSIFGELVQAWQGPKLGCNVCGAPAGSFKNALVALAAAAIALQATGAAPMSASGGGREQASALPTLDPSPSQHVGAGGGVPNDLTAAAAAAAARLHTPGLTSDTNSALAAPSTAGQGDQDGSTSKLVIGCASGFAVLAMAMLVVAGVAWRYYRRRQQPQPDVLCKDSLDSGSSVLQWVSTGWYAGSRAAIEPAEAVQASTLKVSQHRRGRLKDLLLLC